MKALFVLVLLTISSSSYAATMVADKEQPEPICVAFEDSKAFEMTKIIISEHQTFFSYETDDVAMSADLFMPEKGNSFRPSITSIISVPKLTKDGKKEFRGAGLSASGYWGQDDQFKSVYVIDIATSFRVVCYKDKDNKKDSRKK